MSEFHAVIIKHHNWAYTVICRKHLTSGGYGPVSVLGYSIGMDTGYGKPGGVCFTVENGNTEEERMSQAGARAWLADWVARWTKYTRQCVEGGTRADGCAGEVTWGPDPYQQDVHGDSTEYWMCEWHREASAMEI